MGWLTGNKGPGESSILQKRIAALAPRIEGEPDAEELVKLPEGVLTTLENPSTRRIFVTPHRVTTGEIQFEFGPTGFDLTEPGQQIVVVVPQGSTKHLADMLLGHRKREKYWPNGKTLAKGEWDQNAAYTEVLVFDANTNSWKKWSDPLGHDPIKFAEPRATPEIEMLGQWHGMVGDIRPLAVLLVSRSKGDPKLSVITEHSLKLVTRPEITPTMQTLEKIYTPGTSFADFTAKGGTKAAPALAKYGGGKGKYGYNNGQGGYPHAVPLNKKRGCETFPLTEKLPKSGGTPEYMDEQGWMHIRLPAGKHIRSLEISAGCKWTDASVVSYGQAPSTIGVNGGHKLNATLTMGTGGKYDKIIDNANCGPQGVLSGAPTHADYVTQQGDEIIIDCSVKGTVYVMGWRILYDTPKGAAVQEIGTKTHTAVVKTTTTVPEGTATTSKGPKKLIHEPNKKAGGTQGGKWYRDVEDAEKPLYFVKSYASHPEAADRRATEWLANMIYKKMGISAPHSFMTPQGVALKEVPNITGFKPTGHSSKITEAKQFIGGPSSPAYSAIKEGFVVDAWLANRDIFGLYFDNIVKRSDGRTYRLDNGGSMFFHAQGKAKPSFANEVVTEIDTMRDPQIAHEAGHIFKDMITNADIKAQVQKLVQVMTNAEITNLVQRSGISNPTKIIDALVRRRNWLAKTYK